MSNFGPNATGRFVSFVSTLLFVFLNFFAPFFLWTKIIKMTNGPKTVWLVGMCHLANPRFYSTLKNLFSDESFKKSIVLYELVTDKTSLNKDKANTVLYRFLAYCSSVFSKQPSHEVLFSGRPIHGDLDLSEVSEGVQKLLMCTDLDTLLGLNLKTVFHEILETRNEVVLGRLTANLNEADIFILPWGQKHLKGLKTALESKGFRAQKTKYLRPFHLFENLVNLCRGPAQK